MRLSSIEFDRITAQVESALGPENAGALAQDLLVLVACCQRPPALDESQLENWMAGLIATLQRHPAQVAIEAIRAWPRQSGGRWWPMAADMDGLCRDLGARHAEIARQIADAAARRRTHSTDERSSTPIGRSAQFVERIRAAYGEKFVRSWLIGGVNAQFADGTIWLTPFAAERLSRECGTIAVDVGIRLCADADLSATLARYCHARGIEL